MDGLASSPAELRSETHWDQREEVLFLPLAAEVTRGFPGAHSNSTVPGKRPRGKEVGREGCS